jgi:hypothetical protein
MQKPIRGLETKKRPFPGRFSGGRGWDRTSDPSRVKCFECRIGENARARFLAFSLQSIAFVSRPFRAILANNLPRFGPRVLFLKRNALIVSMPS